MSNNLIEIMRFEIGSQSFGILRSHVQSVQQAARARITHNNAGKKEIVLPTTQGELPIVNLTDFLTTDIDLDVEDEQLHILVLRSEWGLWGMLVGRVAQAEFVSESAIQPLPMLARVIYADSVLTRKDDALLMLNPLALHPQAQQHSVAEDKLRPGVDWENSKPEESGHLILFGMPGTGEAGAKYAVGLTPKQIDEVLRQPLLQKVPTAPSYVHGVVNWRGQLVPVLDLGLRYGLQTENGQQIDTQSRVVIAHGNMSDKPIAFYAEPQVEFLTLPVEHKRIVELESVQRDLIHGAAVYNGQPVIIPHLENLASSHIQA